MAEQTDSIGIDIGEKSNILSFLDKASVNYSSILKAINEELAEVRLDQEKRTMLAADLGVPEDVANRWETVNDVVKHFDLSRLAKKHPDAAKSLAVNIFLGVGTVCPPLLSVAAVLKVIPANVLAKVNGWTLSASPDHLAHIFIERQAEKKRNLQREFFVDEPVLPDMKKLVVVLEDDELYAQVVHFVNLYNATPDVAVFGQKIQMARWTEEKWDYRRKRGMIDYRILIAGRLKGTKELREMMNIKAAEYGVRCGFLGNVVCIDADPSALSKKAVYEEFLQKLSELPVPEYRKQEQRVRMNLETGAKAALFPPLLMKDAFDRRKEREKQQLLYGLTQFCYYGLEELMGGPL